MTPLSKVPFPRRKAPGGKHALFWVIAGPAEVTPGGKMDISCFVEDMPPWTLNLIPGQVALA